MEFLAPSNLPGVGMGDLTSIGAICGLLGLAVTSGLLIAEGLIGTVLFCVGAVAVLNEKPDFGGTQWLAWVVLGVLVALAVARIVVQGLARAGASDLRGAAADAPETKSRRAGVARLERAELAFAMAGVLLAGAATGFAWAEWNEAPFHIGDTESWIGIAIGIVAAAVGGDAAWRFLRGAVRAGGSAIIVGIALCIAALLLNVSSVYVPLVGGLVFIVTLVFALRLRRREQKKFAGLRILT